MLSFKLTGPWNQKRKDTQDM